MLILAGQGNPGAKYAKNRHNAGFLLLDRIHAEHGFGPWRAKFDGEISEGAVETQAGRQKVLLLKPQTFYNESGRAMSKACTFYKVGPGAVIVLHDEIDLAPGRQATMACARRLRIWGQTCAGSEWASATRGTSRW